MDQIWLLVYVLYVYTAATNPRNYLVDFLSTWHQNILECCKTVKPEHFSVKWSSEQNLVGLTMGQSTTETSTTGSQPPRFPETYPLPRSTANVMLLANRNGQHTMTGWHWVRKFFWSRLFLWESCVFFWGGTFSKFKGDPRPHLPMHPNATVI